MSGWRKWGTTLLGVLALAHTWAGNTVETAIYFTGFIVILARRAEKEGGE